MTQTYLEDAPAEKLGRVLLSAVQEVLGRSAAAQIMRAAGLDSYIKEYQENNLNLKFSTGALSGILNATEAEYGVRAGRGLILRMGEAAFKYGLREFGPELGLGDLAFRLLPLNRRIAFLVNALAAPLNAVCPDAVQVGEESGRFLWQVGCAAAGEHPPDGGQLCSLLVGFLRAAMYWATGGKPTMVESTPVGTEPATLCAIGVYKKT